MNPLQQAEQLKHLSDQQLQQERGRMPEYLLVAELSRRDQMRKAYQADVDKQKGPRPTVSEEMWAKMQPPPMMPQPQQMQQGMPSQQMMAPPPQAMSVGGMLQRLARGGMVRYAEGGQAPAPAMTREDLMAMAGQRPDIAQYVQQARGMVGEQDNLSPIMAELAALKAKQVVNKPSVWQSLMQMGAGMMASRNPTPLGGLGEGMQQAIHGYGQQREAYQADQARMQQQAIQNLQQRAAIAQQQNQRQMGIADLAGRLQGDASHQWNMTASALQNARMAAQNQAADMERARLIAEREAPYRDALSRKALADASQQEAENALLQQMGPKKYAEWQASLRRQPHQMNVQENLLMRAYGGDERAASILGLDLKTDRAKMLLVKEATDDARARYAIEVKDAFNMTREQKNALYQELLQEEFRNRGLMPSQPQQQVNPNDPLGLGIAKPKGAAQPQKKAEAPTAAKTSSAASLIPEVAAMRALSGMSTPQAIKDLGVIPQAVQGLAGWAGGAKDALMNGIGAYFGR